MSAAIDFIARGLAISLRPLANGATSALPPFWNMSALRNWNMFKGQFAEGQNVTFDMALIADSYGQRPDRYSQFLADQLAATYTDAGAGWIGFGYPGVGPSQVNGAGRWPTYPVTFSGAGWTTNYNGAGYAADLCGVLASTAGNRIMVGFPAGTASIKLYCRATTSAQGVIRYSYDGGTTWTDLTLTGTSAVQFDLVSPPSSAFTLTIETNGTTVAGLGGLYHKNSNVRGVRFSKIAGSGSRAQYYANAGQLAPNQIYRNILASLNCKLMIISIGTNDQDHQDGSFASKAEYKGYIETIIQQLRDATVNPSMDILLAPPIENNRAANPIPMVQYQEACFELAQQYDTAFLDVQAGFGPVNNPAYYAWNGTFRVMDPDLLHPFPATGGKIYANRLLQALATSL